MNVGSSSNVAQFEQQVKHQSTPDQTPQIFNFMEHHHGVQFPYQQVPSTYINFPP